MKKISYKKKLRTFYIYTLGCKTNQSESDVISGKLTSSGLRQRELDENPDVIIINTCTVTSAADRKSRQLIRRAKRGFPSSICVVTGCFTVYNNDFLKKTGVDFVVKNKQKYKIPSILGLKNGLTEKQITFSGHSRVLVKIQDGCEQKCSYCIIPFVRGNYYSRPCKEIIDEVKQLEKDNHDEVVITGIHIGKYGLGMHDNNNGKKNLYSLLNLILEKTSIKRIRLGSIEINELTKDIANLISSCDGRIARHLHIPLQSGSDDILKMMNRPYNRKYFLKRIEKIKSVIPDISLTTDVIVGFPAEGRDDFLKTIDIIKKVLFSKLHVFKFSPRRHTKAFFMKERVDNKKINSRSKILRDLGEDLRKRYIDSLAGKNLYVVCEEYDIDGNIASGVSEQYVKAYFNTGYDNFIRNKGKIKKLLASSPYRDGIKSIDSLG